MNILKQTQQQILSETTDDTLSYIVEIPDTRLENVVLQPDTLKGLQDFLANIDAIRSARRQLGLTRTIDYGRSILVLLHGPTGTGKTMTARALANHAQQPLVTFRRTHGYEPDQSFQKQLATFLEELGRNGGFGLIDECQTYLREDDSDLDDFLAEIEQHDVILFLATTRPEVLGAALDRRIGYKVAMTQPTPEQRRQIWQNLLPPAMPLTDDVDLHHLAQAFNLNGGYIKNAVLHAVNMAVIRDAEAAHLTMDDLTRACRVQEKCVGAGSLARSVETPAISLTDLHLNPEDKHAAENLARRIKANHVTAANILVAASDLATAEDAAKALAGTNDTMVSVIKLGLLMDGDYRRSNIDTAAVLWQSLDAAWESGHIMLISGLDSAIFDHDIPACRIDDTLIRFTLAHPGIKLFPTCHPTRFLDGYRHEFIDILNLSPPDHATRTRQWRSMLMDLKDKVQVERGEGWQEPCEEMLRELARYELSGAQMHQAMERVQWCGGGVTADRLLLAARFVAELGKTGEVLF